MILALIDHDHGKLNPVTLEMLTLGRDVATGAGTSLEAAVVGEEGRALAEEVAAYGVEKVHVVTHEQLDEYAPEAWARSLTQLVKPLSPEAVLGPGSERGNELLAHMAALTDQPLAANCTEINPGEPYRVTRVRWGGSLLEEATVEGDMPLFSVAPHALEAEAVSPTNPAVETFTPELDEKAFRVRLAERVETSEDKVSLGEARLVVGGGRGVGSEDGFAALEELAGLLGGAVGGSRVVTNLGWRAHADQIGQTGMRIAPDLYIACGISGAIQHMVGAKGAKQILAINTDREAPIMSKADYAVIGDLHEVLPALIEAIKQKRD